MLMMVWLLSLSPPPASYSVPSAGPCAAFQLSSIYINNLHLEPQYQDCTSFYILFSMSFDLGRVLLPLSSLLITTHSIHPSISPRPILGKLIHWSPFSSSSSYIIPNPRVALCHSHSIQQPAPPLPPRILVLLLAVATAGPSFASCRYFVVVVPLSLCPATAR